MTETHVALTEEGTVLVPLNGFLSRDLDQSTALIPGRRRTGRGWEWGFSREVLERLHFDLGLEMDVRTKTYLHYLRDLPEPDPARATPLLLPDDRVQAQAWYATTPGRLHQLRFKAWRRGHGLDGRVHRTALLEAGKGLGKTLSGIEETLELFERRTNPHVLVLARNSNLTTVWAEQIEEHAAGLPYTILNGPRKRRLEVLQATLRAGGPHVFIHNHEDLPAMGKALATATEWDLAIVDESSRFRTAGAGRTRLLTGASATPLRADTKLALSGLPVIKRTSDLYPTLKWLGAPVGDKNAFQERFVVLGGYGDAQEIAVKDVRGLNRLLDHYRFVVPKGTVLNLPRNWHYERVELRPWQKEIYRRVRKDLRTRFVGPDGKISEKLIRIRLEEMLRLTQVTAGFEAIDSAHYNWRDDNAKTEHLLNEVLPDLAGEKVILWAHYQAEIRELVRLTRRAGWNAVAFFGGQSDDANDRDYRAFTKGDANLLVANTVKGGAGLNLPMAHAMVFYTRTFDVESWQQALDRNSRLSTDPGAVLNVVVLEAVDTSDQSITRVLGDDMRRAAQITALDVAEMLGVAA